MICNGAAGTIESQAAEIARLTAERDALLKLLALAVDTCEGLSDQQAMYNDWYEPALAECRAAIDAARK